MATYGDRYGAGPAFKPGSMGLALGPAAAPAIAPALGVQITRVIHDPPPFTTYPVAPEPPPPPPDPQPQPKAKAPIENIFVPPPVYTPPLRSKG